MAHVDVRLRSSTGQYDSFRWVNGIRNARGFSAHPEDRPGAHCWGTMVPTPGHSVPAGHGSHSSERTWSVYVPGRHFRQ